jgi:hypothetical protein
MDNFQTVARIADVFLPAGDLGGAEPRSRS